VATLTNHLAVVANFVGALLGAKTGLHEVPIFSFAVGVVHCGAVRKQLPKELHPVFFLFIAAPSISSVG
jgi:hypothetical protein